MDFKELALEDRQKFDNIFYKNPAILELHNQKVQYEKRHDFINAIKTAKKIEEIHEATFQRWYEDLQKEVEAVNLNSTNLPNEAKGQINILYVTAFMACDIIESAVLDMDDLLKKYDRTLSIAMFDELKQLSEKAKEKIRFFQRTSNCLKYTMWGEKCDDIYDMMQGKAKEIIRKDMDEMNKDVE